MLERPFLLRFLQLVDEVGVAPGEQAPAVPHLDAEPALLPGEGEGGLGQALAGGHHGLVGIPPFHGDENLLHRGGFHFQCAALDGQPQNLGPLGPVEPAGLQGLHHRGIGELFGSNLHKAPKGIVKGMLKRKVPMIVQADNLCSMLYRR